MFFVYVFTGEDFCGFKRVASERTKKPLNPHCPVWCISISLYIKSYLYCLILLAFRLCRTNLAGGPSLEVEDLTSNSTHSSVSIIECCGRLVVFFFQYVSYMSFKFVYVLC